MVNELAEGEDTETPARLGDVTLTEIISGELNVTEAGIFERDIFVNLK